MWVAYSCYVFVSLGSSHLDQLLMSPGAALMGPMPWTVLWSGDDKIQGRSHRDFSKSLIPIIYTLQIRVKRMSRAWGGGSQMDGLKQVVERRAGGANTLSFGPRRGAQGLVGKHIFVPLSSSSFIPPSPASPV